MATGNGTALQSKGNNGAQHSGWNGKANGAMPRHDEASDTVEVNAQELQDMRGQLAAISKGQAVIEFDLDGNVLTANANFLSTLGYRLEEIQGRHHSMFVDPAHRNSVEYKQFWADLNAGRYQAAQYKRIGKGGKEVWIQASYNPIFDDKGRPRRSSSTPRTRPRRRRPSSRRSGSAQSSIVRRCPHCSAIAT